MTSNGSQGEPDSEVPRHVAIIMDGNGRWAKKRGLPRLAGHNAGAKSVRRVVEESRRLGIRYLTLFSFSTENWNRSGDEVSGLMKLFRKHLDAELDDLVQNGIRLRAVGDLQRLPGFVCEALERDIERTKENTAMDLVLAVSYGGREEIVEAARALATDVKEGRLNPEDIDQNEFRNRLWTKDIPDPDLLIRTSGEMRISNFLLWQLAYAELVITPTYWPEFNEEVLRDCLEQYRRRERRFGLTTEQIRELGPAADLSDVHRVP